MLPQYQLHAGGDSAASSTCSPVLPPNASPQPGARPSWLPRASPASGGPRWPVTVEGFRGFGRGSANLVQLPVHTQRKSCTIIAVANLHIPYGKQHITQLTLEVSEGSRLAGMDSGAPAPRSGRLRRVLMVTTIWRPACTAEGFCY